MMEQSYWTEKFIVCVEKRPALYDKSKKEYSERNAKEKLWQEVCETVVPNWSELTSQEKINKGKDVQRKWQNLRSCFKRELRLQKETKSGQAKAKRRKYVYYDQLLFLLPTIEDRETVSDIAPVEPNEDNPAEDGDGDGEELDESPRPQSPNTSRSQPTVPSVKRSKKAKVSYEESLLHILQQKSNEAIDEDKTFLLSLVPTFKKLTDDQKLQVKMEFLNVLRKVQASTSATLPRPTSNLAAVNMQNSTISNYENHHRQSVPSTSNYNYINTLLRVNNTEDYSRSSSSCSYTAPSVLSPSYDTMADSQQSELYELH